MKRRYPAAFPLAEFALKHLLKAILGYLKSFPLMLSDRERKVASGMDGLDGPIGPGRLVPLVKFYTLFPYMLVFLCWKRLYQSL